MHGITDGQRNLKNIRHFDEDAAVLRTNRATREQPQGKLVDENRGSNFTERIKHLKQKIAADMGIVIEYMAVFDNLRLSPQSYIVKVRGKQVAAGEIIPSRYLIMEHAGIFKDIDGIDTKDPAFGIPAKWIEPENVEKAKELGYFAIDPLSVIVTHLTEIIKTHADEF